MKKTKTMELKGKQYAQVKDRLQEFRQENPQASIKTTYTIEENQVAFTAFILKDKADPNSADATGHSYGENKGDKSFEKLETIAVGRALAFLGYATDGEIASSDEMEEFLEHKEEKKKEAILEATKQLKGTKTLASLKKVWSALPIEIKEALGDLKDDLKNSYPVNESNEN